VKILLTNDDGIDAPGIAALKQALLNLDFAAPVEVVVAAPHVHLSGCSHRVTTDAPVSVQQVGPGRYAVEGTSADCTRIGLLHLAAEADWVLSGINQGGNLGVDVYLSGTVAATREAALMGRPAIAISQYRRSRGSVDWQAATAMARQVIETLLAEPEPGGGFWNVNLPDPQDVPHPVQVVHCPIDLSPLPVRYELTDGKYHYRGVYQNRPRLSGADVDVCFGGNIAVSRVILGQAGH